MCEPATIAAGATLVIGAMSAYNQNQQSKYQSAVASQNADIAEAQAQDAVNRGNIQAAEVQRRNRQAAGTQAATMGATGADLSTGTSLDIFGDTAQFGTLDALTTVNNAQREAYGYQVQSVNYDAEAKAARSAGKANATMTLLSTPLKAFGAYQTFGGTWSPFTQSSAAPISAASGTKTGR
ncbi:TPA: hypothetical protein ACGRRT_001645 [Klebsiella aerogenes]|uniref:virion core protein, T7 gp14 family n=1 Tax=Klebsiella aerogenes TaxID=548 RepID=UPI000665C94D|nr:hypothetical protein [Klebsiella aerogenes]AVE99171.1 hypothetical protein AM441_11265 [Klebsiella aerogenes]AYY00843.1 hypothetical protein EGY11_12285 [Klebsiella aerogenes]EIV3812030.1 hypothetical protein [Klebsiella aerogenes]EKY0125643.1 hypothetical protein [Klebsiella aerogenes]ELA2154238.1 hypothetical protein [Klebsiella aerogenes]